MQASGRQPKDLLRPILKFYFSKVQEHPVMKFRTWKLFERAKIGFAYFAEKSFEETQQADFFLFITKNYKKLIFITKNYKKLIFITKN